MGEYGRHARSGSWEAPPAPRLEETPRAGPEKSRARIGAAGLVAPLILVVVSVWLVWYGGFGLVVGSVTGVVEALTPSAEGSETLSRAELVRARAVFQESAPDEFDIVYDIDTPTVARGDGWRSYTWHYYPVSGENDGIEQSITLWLDPEGRSLGVRRSE